MKEDYAKWSYAPYISDAIRNEVKECRENVALFDLSSFGKVRNRVAVGISVPVNSKQKTPTILAFDLRQTERLPLIAFFGF